MKIEAQAAAIRRFAWKGTISKVTRVAAGRPRFLGLLAGDPAPHWGTFVGFLEVLTKWQLTSPRLWPKRERAPVEGTRVTASSQQ